MKAQTSHLNGRRVVLAEAPRLASPAPTCPKRCDVATPAEHAGGDRWVCVACGTEFTWKETP